MEIVQDSPYRFRAKTFGLRHGQVCVVIGRVAAVAAGRRRALELDPHFLAVSQLAAGVVDHP